MPRAQVLRQVHVTAQPGSTDSLIYLFGTLGPEGRADEVEEDVGRACTVIRTLVPGRRSPREFFCVSGSAVAAGRDEGTWIACLPM